MPDWFNSAAVTGAIAAVAGLVIAVIGLGMLLKSNKTKPAAQASSAVNVLIAAVVIVGGLGGVFFAVANGTLDFLVKKG